MPTTPPSVEVNACCAPMTSLLSREISAPVWVRVKNASGCAARGRRPACAGRRSGPRRCARSTSGRSAPMPALDEGQQRRPGCAVSVTTGEFPAVMPWSMIRRNSSGCATTSTASNTRVTRNPMISRRYGRAKPRMRRSVPSASFASRRTRRCGRTGAPHGAAASTRAGNLSLGLRSSPAPTRRGRRLIVPVRRQPEPSRPRQQPRIWARRSASRWASRRQRSSARAQHAPWSPVRRRPARRSSAATRSPTVSSRSSALDDRAGQPQAERPRRRPTQRPVTHISSARE